MNELNLLIETAIRLTNRLSMMAANELEFGFNLCHHLEQVSYQSYCVACDLKEIKYHLLGDLT